MRGHWPEAFGSRWWWIPATLTVVGLTTASTPQGLSARQQTQPPDTIQSELEVLKARIDSMEAIVRGLAGKEEEAKAADALAQLRAAAAAAAGEESGGGSATPTAAPGVGRQRALQALNPEISVTGDILGQVNPDHAGEENFIPREFELSLVSALDPFSRAKVFMAFHQPGGEITPFEEEGHEHEHEEGEVAVEEGYMEWVNLPGGFGLTLGRFSQRLGTMNRWHSHALYFQTRSLPHLAFIGEEPLAQTGFSLYSLLPVERFGTWQAWMEVTRASNEALFGESQRLTWLGHLNAFWELSRSWDLDLGGSFLTGRYEDPELVYDQRFWNLEGALTWRPPGRSGYREAVFRGGVMIRDPADASVGQTPSGATGVWTLAELRLAPQWLVGARYDWVENPEDPQETAWLISPTVTWWQSEFVRVRAEYDLLGRDSWTNGQFMMQVTFAMGPHKHEKY